MQENNTKAHIPTWAEEGCKVLETWEDTVYSGPACGTRTRVKFINKKGKEITMTKWIKWV